MNEGKAIPDHGTYACYVSGCRRDACKAAMRDYMRAYRRQGRDSWVNRTYGECVSGLGWPRAGSSGEGRAP